MTFSPMSLNSSCSYKIALPDVIKHVTALLAHYLWLGSLLMSLNGNLRQTCVSWNGHQAATPQLVQCAGSSRHGSAFSLMELLVCQRADVHLWELPVPDGLTASPRAFNLLYAHVVGLWVNAKHVTVQLQLSAVKITINNGRSSDSGRDSYQVHCDVR